MFHVKHPPVRVPPVRASASRSPAPPAPVAPRAASRPGPSRPAPRRASDRLVARLRPCPFRHQPPAPARARRSARRLSSVGASPSFRMFHVKHLARRRRPSGREQGEPPLMAKRHRIRKRPRAFAARGARSRRFASLRPGAMRKKGFRCIRSPAQNFRIRWFLAMGRALFRRRVGIVAVRAGGTPQRNRRGRGRLRGQLLLA